MYLDRSPLIFFSFTLYFLRSHGFRHIDISNNPLGEGGARELAEAIRKTMTIKSLKLRCCSINEAGIKHLHSALAINQSIKFLDIEGNDISAVSVYTALAEVQAANDVDALREDPNAVDANALTVYVSKDGLFYCLSTLCKQYFLLYGYPLILGVQCTITQAALLDEATIGVIASQSIFQYPRVDDAGGATPAGAAAPT